MLPSYEGKKDLYEDKDKTVEEKKAELWQSFEE